MKKRLKAIISYCIECTHSEENYMDGDFFFTCAEAGNPIYNMFEIPDWCPLEDYEEEKGG